MSTDLTTLDPTYHQVLLDQPFSSAFFAAYDGPRTPFVDTFCGGYTGNLSLGFWTIRGDMFKLIRQIDATGHVHGHLGTIEWDEQGEGDDPRLDCAQKILVQATALAHAYLDADTLTIEEIVAICEGALRSGFDDIYPYDRNAIEKLLAMPIREA